MHKCTSKSRLHAIAVTLPYMRDSQCDKKSVQKLLRNRSRAVDQTPTEYHSLEVVVVLDLEHPRFDSMTLLPIGTADRRQFVDLAFLEACHFVVHCCRPLMMKSV